MLVSTSRFAAAADAGGDTAAVSEGEIIAAPAEATCRACHNAQSPTFERFCYYEFRDRVSHTNPKQPRTQAERDARLVCVCKEACACIEACPRRCQRARSRSEPHICADRVPATNG